MEALSAAEGFQCSTGRLFPTAELDFLQLRQQLKTRIRNNHMKELDSTHGCSVDKKKFPCDDFGSFFGPSQHCIAQRVIKESKSLMPELKNLASRVTSSHDKGKKSPSLTVATQKSGQAELKTRCRNLKESRDYSFLFSDNAAIPATSKGEPGLGKDSDSSSNERKTVSSTPRPCMRGLKSVKTQKKPSLRLKIPEVHGTSSSASLCAKRKQSEQQKGCQPKKFNIDSEDRNVDVSSVIKEIFGRNRRRYRADKDDDDGVMVSTFDDIMKEERNSKKIAMEEDQRECLLIKQEEKQERLRKEKKQKLKASK